MTSNADFMIHNPWGMAGGESADIQKYAEELKEAEDKIADFYSKKTKLSKEQALESMKKTTFMSAEKALETGFITQIETVMRAVALYKKENQNQDKMTEEVKKAVAQETNSLWEKIQGLFKNEKPQALSVQDANGATIDFPDVEDRDPEVGDKATVDGSPASGEYVMTNGETYVFESGTLTEIKAVESEDSEEMEALKKENAELKEQVEAQAKAQKESESKAQAKAKEMDEIKASMLALKGTLISAGIELSEKEQPRGGDSGGDLVENPASALLKFTKRHKQTA
jgi:hypothetical protein